MADTFKPDYLREYSSYNFPTKVGNRLEGVQSYEDNSLPTFSTVGALTNLTYKGAILSSASQILDLKYSTRTTTHGFGFKLWRSQQLSASSQSSYYSNQLYNSTSGQVAGTDTTKPLSFGFITDNLAIRDNKQSDEIIQLDRELNAQFQQFSSLTTSRVRYKTINNKRIAVGVEVKIPMEFYGGTQVVNKSLFFTIDAQRNLIEQSTNKIIPTGSIGFTLTPALQNALDLKAHPPLTNPTSIITSVINEISTTSKARSYYNVVDRAYNYLSNDQRKLLLDRALGRIMAKSLSVSTLPSNLTLTDILQGAISGKHVNSADLTKLVENLTKEIARKASRNAGIFGSDPALNAQVYNKIRIEDKYNKTLMDMFRPLMTGGVNSLNVSTIMQGILAELSTNLDATTPVNSLGNSIRTPMLRALKLSALQESTQTAIALKILNKESVNKAKEIALSPYLMPHEQGYSQGQMFARMTYSELLGKDLIADQKDPGKPKRMFFQEMVDSTNYLSVGSAFELIGMQEPGITLRGAEKSHSQQNMPFGKTTRLLTSTASADSNDPFEITRAGKAGVESKIIVYDNERLFKSMSQLYSITAGRAASQAGSIYEQAYKATLQGIFGEGHKIEDNQTIYMLPFKKPDQTVQRLKNLLGAKSAIQFNYDLIDKIKNQQSIETYFQGNEDGLANIMAGNIPIALPPEQYKTIISILGDIIKKAKTDPTLSSLRPKQYEAEIKKRLVNTLRKKEVELQPLKGLISGDETRAVLINLGINDLSDPFQVNEDYLNTKAFGHRMLTKIKFQSGSSQMTTTSGNLFFNNPYLKAQIDVVNSFTPGKTVVYTSTTSLSSESKIYQKLLTEYRNNAVNGDTKNAIAILKRKYRFLKDIDISSSNSINFKIVAGMYDIGDDFKFYGEYESGQVQLLYSPQTIGKLDTTTATKNTDDINKNIVNYNFNTFSINIAGSTYKTTNGIFVLTDSLQLNAEEGANMTGIIQWGLSYDPIGRPGYSLIKGPFNSRDGILFSKYLEANKGTNPFARQNSKEYFGYTGVGAIKGYNYEAGLELLKSTNVNTFNQLLNIEIGNTGVKLSTFLVGIGLVSTNKDVRESLRSLVDTNQKVQDLISAFEKSLKLNGQPTDRNKLSINVQRLVSMIKERGDIVKDNNEKYRYDETKIKAIGFNGKLDTLLLKHPSLLDNIQTDYTNETSSIGQAFAKSIAASLSSQPDDFDINSLFQKAIQTRTVKVENRSINLDAFNEHDVNVRAAGLLADVIYSNLQITTFQSIGGKEKSISEIGFHRKSDLYKDKEDRFNRVTKHTRAVNFILHLSGLKLSKQAREALNKTKPNYEDIDDQVRDELDQVLDIVFYRFSNSPIIQKYLPVMPSSSLVAQGKESAVGLEFQYSLAMSSNTLNYLRGTGLDFEGETAFAAAYNTIINFLQDPLTVRRSPTALKFHSAFSLLDKQKQRSSNSFIDYLKLSSALGLHGNKLVRELKLGGLNRSLAEEAILAFIHKGPDTVDAFTKRIQEFSTGLATSMFDENQEQPLTDDNLSMDRAVGSILNSLQSFDAVFSSSLSNYESIVRNIQLQIKGISQITQDSIRKATSLFRIAGIVDANNNITDINRATEILLQHDLKIKQMTLSAISESTYTKFISSLHQEAALAKSIMSKASLMPDSNQAQAIKAAQSILNNVYQTRAIALPNITVSVDPVYGKKGVAEIVNAQEGHRFQSFSIKLLGLDILQSIPLEFGNYTSEIVATQQKLRELLPDYFRILEGIKNNKGRLVINHMDKEIISTVEELAVTSNFDLEKIATGIMGQHAIGEVNKYPGVSTSNTISSLLLDVHEAIAGSRIFGNESPYLESSREAEQMRLVPNSKNAQFYKINKKLQSLNFKKFIPRNIEELKITISTLSDAIQQGIELNADQQRFLDSYMYAVNGKTPSPNSVLHTIELNRLKTMTKELTPEKAEKVAEIVNKIKGNIKDHQRINQYNYKTIKLITLSHEEIKLLKANVSDYEQLKSTIDSSNEKILQLEGLYLKIDQEKSDKRRYTQQIEIKRQINQLHTKIDDERRRLNIAQTQAYKTRLESKDVLDLTNTISEKYTELSSLYKERSNLIQSNNSLFAQINEVNENINKLYSSKTSIGKLTSISRIKEIAASHYAYQIATEVKRYFHDHLKDFSNITAQTLTNLNTKLPATYDIDLYTSISTQVENDNLFSDNPIDIAIKDTFINSIYNATVELSKEVSTVKTFTDNKILKEIKNKYKEFKSLLNTKDKSQLDFTSFKNTPYEKLIKLHIQTEAEINLLKTTQQQLVAQLNEVSKKIKELKESNPVKINEINNSIKILKAQLTNAKVVDILPKDHLNQMWSELGILESKYADAKKGSNLKSLFSQIIKAKADLTKINKLNLNSVLSNINLVMKHDVYSIIKQLDKAPTPTPSIIEDDIVKQIDNLKSIIEESKLKIENLNTFSEIELLNIQSTQNQVNSLRKDINLLNTKLSVISGKTGNLLLSLNKNIVKQKSELTVKQELVQTYLSTKNKLEETINKQLELFNIQNRVQAQNLLKEIKAIEAINKKEKSYYIKTEDGSYKPLSHAIEAGQTIVKDLPIFLITESVNNYQDMYQEVKTKQEELAIIKKTIRYAENNKRHSIAEDIKYYRSLVQTRAILNKNPDLKIKYGELITSLESSTNRLNLYSEIRNKLNLDTDDTIKYSEATRNIIAQHNNIKVTSEMKVHIAGIYKLVTASVESSEARKRLKDIYKELRDLKAGQDITKEQLQKIESLLEFHYQKEAFKIETLKQRRLSVESNAFHKTINEVVKYLIADFTVADTVDIDNLSNVKNKATIIYSTKKEEGFKEVKTQSLINMVVDPLINYADTPLVLDGITFREIGDKSINLSLFISNIEKTLNSGSMGTRLGNEFKELNKRINEAKALKGTGSEAFVNLINNLLVKESKTQKVAIHQETLRTIFRLAKGTYADHNQEYREEYDKYLGNIKDENVVDKIVTSVIEISDKFKEVIKLSTKKDLYKEMRDKGEGNALTINIINTEPELHQIELNRNNAEIRGRIADLIKQSKITTGTTKANLEIEINHLIEKLSIDAAREIRSTTVTAIPTADKIISLVATQADLILELQKKSRQSIKAVSALHTELNKSIVNQQQINFNKIGREISTLIEDFESLDNINKNYINAEEGVKKLTRNIESLEANKSINLNKVKFYAKILDVIHSNLSTKTTDKEVLKSAIEGLLTNKDKENTGINKVLSFIDNSLEEKFKYKTFSKILTKDLTSAEKIHLQFIQTEADILRKQEKINRLNERLEEQKGKRINQAKVDDYLKLNKIVATAKEIAIDEFSTFSSDIVGNIKNILNSDISTSEKYRKIYKISAMNLTHSEQKLLSISIEQQKIDSLNNQKSKLVALQTKVQDYLTLSSVLGTPTYLKEDEQGNRFINKFSSMRSDIKVIAVSKKDDIYTAHASILYSDNVIELFKQKGLESLQDNEKDNFKSVISSYQDVRNRIQRIIKNTLNKYEKGGEDQIRAARFLTAISSPLMVSKLDKDKEAEIAVEYLNDSEKLLYNYYTNLVVEAETLINNIGTTIGFNEKLEAEGGLLDTITSKNSKLTLNEKIERAASNRISIVDSAINYRLNEFNKIKEEIATINEQLNKIDNAPEYTIDKSDTILNAMVEDQNKIVGMILRAAAPTGGSHVQHAYSINRVDELIKRATEQESLLKLSMGKSDAIAVLPAIGAFGTQGADFDGDSYQILLKYHDTYKKYLKTKQSIKDLENSIKNNTNSEFNGLLQEQLTIAENQLIIDREIVNKELELSKKIQEDWIKRIDNQVRRHVASFTGMPLDMLLDEDLFTREQVSTMIQQQRGIHKDIGELKSSETQALLTHFQKILTAYNIDDSFVIQNQNTLKDTFTHVITDYSHSNVEEEKLNQQLLSKISAGYFDRSFKFITVKEIIGSITEELATIETVQHAFKSQAGTIDAAAGTVFDDQTYEGLQSFIGEVGTTLIGKGYNALIPLMSRGANIRVFSDFLDSQANIGISDPGSKPTESDVTRLSDILSKVKSPTLTESQESFLPSLVSRTEEKAQKITGALGMLQQIIRDSIKLKPTTSGKSGLIQLLLQPENKKLTDQSISDEQQALNYRDFISTADITGTDLDATAELNAFGAILLLSDYTDARSMATSFTGSGTYVFDTDVFNKQIGFSKQEVESSKRFSIFRQKEDYFLALANDEGQSYLQNREKELRIQYENELRAQHIGKLEREDVRKYEEKAALLARKDRAYFEIEETMLKREYGLTAKQFGIALLKEKQEGLETDSFSFREELIANTIAEMLNRATAIDSINKTIAIDGQEEQTKSQLLYLRNIFTADDTSDEKYQKLQEKYRQAYGDEYIETSRAALVNTNRLYEKGSFDDITMSQMREDLVTISFINNQFQGITGQDIKYLGNVATSKRRMLNMDYSVQSAYSPFMNTAGEAMVAYQGLIRRGKLVDSPEQLADLNEKISLDMARSLYETGKRIDAINSINAGDADKQKITTGQLQQAMAFAADAVEMVGLRTKDLLETQLEDYVNNRIKKAPSINEVKQERTDEFLNYLLEKDAGTEGTRLQRIAARQAGAYQIAEYNKSITALQQRILQIDLESPNDSIKQSEKQQYQDTKREYEDELKSYNQAVQDLLKTREQELETKSFDSEAELQRQNAMNMVLKAIEDLGTKKLIEDDITNDYLSEDTSYLNTREFRDQQKLIRQTKINQTMNILAAPLLSGILASGMDFDDYAIMSGYDVIQGYAGFKTDKNLMGKLAGDVLATKEYEKFSRMSAGFAKQRMRDQLAAEGTLGLATGVGFEMASRGIASLAADGVTRVIGALSPGGVGSGISGVFTEVLSDVAASSVYTVSQVVARDKAGTSRMLGRPMESYMPTANLIETLANTADVASYLTEGLLEILQEEGGGDPTVDSEVSFDVNPEPDIMSMYAYLGLIDMDMIQDQAGVDTGSVYGEVQNPFEMFSNS